MYLVNSMGAIYILPKPGERELPEWAKRHNDEQQAQDREHDPQADKQSQDNWGYKP